jgi:hypothetical protein
VPIEDDDNEVGGPTRAVVIGGLPTDTIYHDLTQMANRFGGVESVRIFPSRRTAVIIFFDPSSAGSMIAQFSSTPLLIHAQPVKLNWAKSSPLSTELAAQVRAGATRNLWVGGIAEAVDEELLRDVFAPFGDFDSIVIMRQKNIAFVNLTSVQCAITSRLALQGAVLHGAPIKINFAKEASRRS